MPSPFDMITHSPIMQLANLARAGQNPMGLIQQLGGQSAPIMQGLNLIQGKNEAQLRTMAQNLAKERGIDLTAENQNLKFAASQDRQNALLTTVMSQQTDTILNRVNPRPIPAYQVANPNVGVNCCGC